MRIKAERDFWAGLLFIAIAAVFLGLSTNYRLGSAQRMGPAYFPIVVASVQAALGLAIAARSFWRTEPGIERAPLRSLLVTLLAVVAFGVALDFLGLVAAIVALVIVGAFADPASRPVETVLLAAFLAFFSVVMFVTVLGLPLQVWPEITWR